MDYILEECAVYCIYLARMYIRWGERDWQKVCECVCVRVNCTPLTHIWVKLRNGAQQQKTKGGASLC